MMVRLHSATDLLIKYVSLHNAGVVIGDFRPLSGILRDDVEIIFAGAVTLHLRGQKEAIDTYNERPPTDSLEIAELYEVGATAACATYSWSSAPRLTVGHITVEAQEGQIRRLTIEIFVDK